MTHTLGILRLLNPQTFTSGAQIAQKMGITRACVNHALQRTEDYGVVLERRVGVGYRLQEPIEWLDMNKIQRGLTGVKHDYHLQIVPHIDSTNTALLKNPEALHGTVLATEWQSKGRARRGRTWQAVVGGSLVFSLKRVFQEMASLSGLSLAIGVAIIRAIKELGIEGVALKWPNDIVCAQGKLGGVLIEVSGDTSGATPVVIGIGLNVKLPSMMMLTQSYADLNTLGFRQDRHILWAKLLIHLYEVLTIFEKETLFPFVTEWEAAHCWQGKKVKVLDSQGVLEGTALGITVEGALRLLTPEGEKIILNGDVSLRKNE